MTRSLRVNEVACERKVADKRAGYLETEYALNNHLPERGESQPRTDHAFSPPGQNKEIDTKNHFHEAMNHRRSSSSRGPHFAVPLQTNWQDLPTVPVPPG